MAAHSNPSVVSRPVTKNFDIECRAPLVVCVRKAVGEFALHNVVYFARKTNRLRRHSGKLTSGCSLPKM